MPNRYANGAARRKLRQRLLATTTNCALCGLPLPSGERLAHMSCTDPEYPVIDEIMPVVAGGDCLSPENTQLVHRLCNARKGDRIPVRTDTGKSREMFRVSRRWDAPGFGDDGE